MLLQEARDHVGAERKRNTPIVFAPAGDVLVRIRPEKIAEEAAVGDLGWSADGREHPPSVPLEQGDYDKWNERSHNIRL